MLALSPLASLNNGDAREEFVLDQDINFDDLFVGFDELPDLEIDPCDIFADFSFTSGEDGDGNNTCSSGENEDKKEECYEESSKEEVKVVSVRKKEDEKPRKKPSTKKLSLSKKKTKNRSYDLWLYTYTTKCLLLLPEVDWTPELHRKFVEAVEKLGVEKAVPSRILELMGIDCLTRHNIASHLQKYRSHRKHLLAREAEAASWSQRRKMYGNSTNHGDGSDTEMLSTKPNWAPPPQQPMVVFPPTTHHRHQHHLQNYRPLHVWGHPPTVEHPKPHQLVFVWPRPPWGPPLPPHGQSAMGPTYWQHPHYQRSLAQGLPCFPPPPLMPPVRFSTPPVTGIPPPHNVAPLKNQCSSHFQLDVQPSNESIDAAIGDVLAKPWLPLPLGLKPPSLDGVMAELHKQGVAKVPPTCV